MKHLSEFEEIESGLWRMETFRRTYEIYLKDEKFHLWTLGWYSTGKDLGSFDTMQEAINKAKALVEENQNG